jgi:hypothetical protein
MPKPSRNKNHTVLNCVLIQQTLVHTLRDNLGFFAKSTQWDRKSVKVNAFATAAMNSEYIPFLGILPGYHHSKHRNLAFKLRQESSA